MQNNLKELWSLFDFVYPGRLGTLPLFRTEFEMPITLGSYVNASKEAVEVAYQCAVTLRETISAHLLQRQKKDVQSQIQLPGREEQV